MYHGFIIKFLKVDSCRIIMVIVDLFFFLFLKYAVFIPTYHACLVDKAAWLFFTNVVKYSKLFKDIISDREARFTGGLTQCSSTSCVQT